MDNRYNFRIGLLVICTVFSLLMHGVSPASANKFKPTQPGEVYLLRGLANIFSLGMDEMGKNFRHLGIESHVRNHSRWRALADDIIERSYKKDISFPIIIIGHSLGAGAAPKMATLLGSYDIPVAYVVLFDPVEPTTVGKNINEVINFYLPHRHGPNIVHPLPDFDGKLENINVKPYGGFTHLNIDYNTSLRNAVYDEALVYVNEEKAKRKLIE